MNPRIGLLRGLLGMGVFAWTVACVAAQPAPPPYYWAEPPGVVEVEPGIAVVPEWHSDVFYSDGWYWTRYEGRWYRGSGRRNGWRAVEAEHVPPRVVVVPPGRYVQWHPPPPAPHPVNPVAYPVAPLGHPVTPVGHAVTPVGHPVTPVGHPVTPVAPGSHPAPSGHSVGPAGHDEHSEEHSRP